MLSALTRTAVKGVYGPSKAAWLGAAQLQVSAPFSKMSRPTDKATKYIPPKEGMAPLKTPQYYFQQLQKPAFEEYKRIKGSPVRHVLDPPREAPVEISSLNNKKLRYSSQKGHVQRAAARGLFEGVHKQYGHNVSFSHKKTKRVWKPNVQRKHLYSATLNQYFTFKMTTKALKTMDKMGGFDSYLLRTNYKKHIIAPKALEIRQHLIKRLVQDEKFLFRGLNGVTTILSQEEALRLHPDGIPEASMSEFEAMKALDLDKSPLELLEDVDLSRAYAKSGKKRSAKPRAKVKKFKLNIFRG